MVPVRVLGNLACVKCVITFVMSDWILPFVLYGLFLTCFKIFWFCHYSFYFAAFVSHFVTLILKSTL